MHHDFAVAMKSLFEHIRLMQQVIASVVTSLIQPHVTPEAMTYPEGGVKCTLKLR